VTTPVCTGAAGVGVPERAVRIMLSISSWLRIFFMDFPSRFSDPAAFLSRFGAWFDMVN
jgi:hypothetical protein